MTKRVIVTGASSGIGEAVAVSLAEPGLELVLVARRAERLSEVAARCRETGARVEVVAVDVTHPDAPTQVFDAAGAMGPGAFPVLVNNAGNAEFGPFADAEWSSIEHQVRLNLLAPMAMCHAFVPYALREGGGQIVNVLSITADLVLPGAAAYSAAKAGLRTFSKCLAADYRRKGIKVSAVLPGAIDTPIWDGKPFVPKREDMLPVEAVAGAIVELIRLPHDRNIEELTIMPPKGLL